VETMQEPKRQPEPPEKEKSERELERERLYRKSDKLRAPKEEEVDWDDPTLGMDSDELQAYYKDKLEKEKGETQLSRRKETMEKIYGKTTPTPEPVRKYDTEEEVIANHVRSRYPDLSDADWKAINKPSFYKTDSELMRLRARVLETDVQADLDAIVDRAVSLLAMKKERAERSAYVDFLKRSRSPNNEAEEAARLHKFMQQRSKV
jgi:hypothetical protein